MSTLGLIFWLVVLLWLLFIIVHTLYGWFYGLFVPHTEWVAYRLFVFVLLVLLGFAEFGLPFVGKSAAPPSYHRRTDVEQNVSYPFAARTYRNWDND